MNPNKSERTLWVAHRDETADPETPEWENEDLEPITHDELGGEG